MSEHSVEYLAQALKEAREGGQQVVPIVGAGLSADCGFPIIAGVVRYLGKLCHYIALRGPVYDYRQHKAREHDIFDHHFTRYEARPWEFLEDFGWPDWFQLNEDLFTKLDDGDRSRPVSSSIESAERKRLNEILPRFNPRGVEQYVKLHTTIDGFLSELKKRSSDNNSELRKAFDEARKKIDSRFETNWSNSARFDVIGDWQRLILYFTNYRSDYADALFARFGATRKPGQGHRFLAFLSKVLAVRTILTFNFDSMIEEALETEGIRYKVFAMERGAGLPYPNLLRDQLSVIKAHGSTHALLLDEQLDRPLSREYLKRFERITGKDPLLLVVGCSAGDRRLRDLVSHVLESSKQKHSVAWLHYEPDPPVFLRESKKKKSRTLTLPTNNPGATLLHLYSWFMSSNPASRVPYLAHVQQPIALAADRPKPGNNGSFSPTVNGHLEVIAVDGSKFLTASQILLKRANEWARDSYQVIWIDLESLHTLAGVIGSIIDQCRKYDPDLPPSLLPVDIDQDDSGVSSNDKFVRDVIEQAAKRVIRALRRARYYLAIDGLGAYAWPATTHHGVTRMAYARGAERRVKSMLLFLQFLDDDLGESRVAVSVDKHTSRYPDFVPPKSAWFDHLFQRAKQQGLEPANNPLFDFENDFSELRKDLPIFSVTKYLPQLEEILATSSKRDGEQRCRALVAMVLFSLSCFRRTRPLVATTYLLEPFLGEFNRDRLQKILKLFTEPGHIPLLQQLEGGSYWFNHSIRDELYAHNTAYTGTSSMRNCLNWQPGQRATAEYRQKTVFQLFLSAITHHRISQIWYNHTFVQSRDTFAFLEYTYHRISSIRNLVKLRALARVGSRNKAIAEDLVKGISGCGKLIRLLCDKKDEKWTFKELGFGEDGPFVDTLRKYPPDSSNRDWCAEAKEIETSLKRRHRRQLHGLFRGWTRAELTLRTQIPAEQLLHWCEELLSDDLIYRCNRMVIDYPEMTSEQAFEPECYNFGSKTKPNYFVDPELEDDGGDLKEFRRFLQDLQVKLWIERSDYRACIRHRRKHLWHSLDKKKPLLKRREPRLKTVSDSDPIDQEIETYQALVDVCEIRQCHQLLYIANCTLKLQQELTCDENGLKREIGKVQKLLHAVAKRLVDLDPKDSRKHSSEINDYNEARLRLLHLQAEAQIGHVSMFSHDGFTGDPKRWKPPTSDVKNAATTIGQALEEIGGRDVHTRAAPRSVILPPTTDAALYLQYRSLFQMFKGRTEWLLDPENKDDGLKKALRSFEMARGGLDNDSSLISALIEIYVAEALLARSRAVLFDVNSKTGFHEAQQAFDSAHGALRRARESLLVSPRHLMWRKLFFRITTQYHSDRLLLRYAQLQDRALKRQKTSERNGHKLHFETNAREALLRLRRAYQTLVSALDLYLPLSAKIEPAHFQRFRWLYRMWWELTLCGYATGRVVIKAIRGTALSKQQAHEYVIQQLRWVNKADGVDDSALKQMFENNYHRLKPEYDRSLNGSQAGTPLKRALTRRRNLIYQAIKLSKDQVS